MKVKVIKPFRDKYTKVVYAKGQEIEVTKERFEEINSAALGPFVKAVEGSEEAKAGEEPEGVETVEKNDESEKKPEKQPKAKTTKAKK